MTDGYGVVYGLLDPRTDELRYVGVTHASPTRRLSQHITSGRRKVKQPVSLWIYKLLGLGLKPQMTILRRGVDVGRDAFDLEGEMILQFRASGCRLLNVAAGGRGGGVGPKSPEHAAKIAAAQKGRKQPPRTPEWRAAHSAKLTGRKHSAETKAKISAANARRRVLVMKVCRCGGEFQVIPSRVDRTPFCGPDCIARKESKRARMAAV